MSVVVPLGPREVPDEERPARGEHEDMSPTPPRVVVGGGGIAALEAVLALDEIAGARLDVTLLAADPRFRYAPLAVAEPFRGGRAYRLDLAEMLAGRDVDVAIGTLDRVDVERRRLHTAAGGSRPYDALLVAVGAGWRNAVPGALAFAGWHASVELRRMLREAAAGRLRRMAFAVPAGVTWTLPAYELALMAAAHFEQEDIDVEIVLVSHEPRPLDILGDRASDAVGELLRSRAVAFHSAAPVRFGFGRLFVRRGKAFFADAVVALPEPRARRIAGLPGDEHGFVPIDEHCRVRGAPGLYAAGDVASFPIKQGGIAAQQAEAAAEAIVADLGQGIAPRRFEPELSGLLLAGAPPRYRRLSDARAHPVTDCDGGHRHQPPPAKVAGRRLAPFLARHGVPPGAPPGSVAFELATVVQPTDDGRRIAVG
jgi:sulfide:quinone oxidoreductase